MGVKTNHEIQLRANAHARGVLDAEVSKLPLVKRLIAPTTDEYQRAYKQLARTFVIAYAAGVEDASSRRTVKP